MKYNPTALSTDLWPLNMAKPRLYVLLCIELIILLGLSLQLTLPADWLAISKASQLASALSGLVGSATDWVRHRPSVDWLPEQPLLTSLLHTGRWAELSVIALFGLLISSTYIHHRSSKKQMDDIRNQIAADLHDEIGSSLSSIGLLGALARNGLSDPHKSACLLNQLVEETRQVSNALDDVVWSVSPRDEQSAYLGARIYRYAANLFETAGIAYQINMPDESVLTQVPTAQQRDLYFFVKGVVSNIIKHAGAT
ncbi:sensor histidine kinase, partial [Fibrivirga algicola]